MRIEEFDENFKLETTLPEKDIVWLDARDEVFDLYGFYNPRTEDRFHRVPKEVYDNCNDGVRGLEGHTAGGRIRFKTDSPFIAIKAEYWLNHMPHMPLSGSSGFDIYMQKNGKFAYLHTAIPKTDSQHGFEYIKEFSSEMTDYVINFPLYNDVKRLYLGFKKGSTVDGCHPTDLGFYRMAGVIGDALENFLK